MSFGGSAVRDFSLSKHSITPSCVVMADARSERTNHTEHEWRKEAGTKRMTQWVVIKLSERIAETSSSETLGASLQNIEKENMKNE